MKNHRLFPVYCLILALTPTLVAKAQDYGQFVAPPPAPPVIYGDPGYAVDSVVPDAEVSLTSTAYNFGNPSGDEQEYLEYIQRARANPTAEGVRLATTSDTNVQQAMDYFSVNKTMLQSEFASISSAPPLAWNSALIDAARGHSQDMFDNDFQGHNSSNGDDLGDRLTDAGYSFSMAGENVYARSEYTWFGHCGFNIDWGYGSGGMQGPPRGHRVNIHNASYREIGVGIVDGTNGSVGPQVVTQDFGSRFNLDPFIVGVVYDDTNENGFYDSGEGISGVTVTVDGQSYHAVTASGGGYSIPVDPSGTYTVSFSGGGVDAYSTSVSVGSTNAKADYIMGDTGTPYTYSISPTSTTADHSGDSGSVTVTATAGAPWTAVSNNAWLQVTSGSSGTGNGSVGWEADANTNPTSRTGTLTIAGHTFAVQQNAAPESVSINPTSASADYDGDSGTVAVTANTSWTAVSAEAWLHVTSGSSGTGNGTVGWSADANAGASVRIGQININGNTFTVTQDAPPIDTTILPDCATFTASGGNGSIEVTANTPWTATSNDAWIIITSGSSGSGNGTVTFSVAENVTGTQRQGTISIADKTFTVNQEPASPFLGISPSSASYPAAGGSSAISVDSNINWTATASDPWVSITSGASGSGDGTVYYTVSANAGGSSRSATIDIVGETMSLASTGNISTHATDASFGIYQAAASSAVTLSDYNLSFGATADSGSVDVTASTPWTATSNNDWIILTSGFSGSGNDTVGFNVAANTSTNSRTGSVTIGDQELTINQSGAGAFTLIDPPSASFDAAGGDGSIAVNSNTDWTAAANQSWVHITEGASGSGDGAVAYTVDQNLETTQRSCTIMVNSQTHIITQSGAGAYIDLTPASRNVSSSAGTGTISVSSNAAWSAVSENVSWLHITEGATGEGNGSISYSYDANPAVTMRTGRIVVGGEFFVLRQSPADPYYSIDPDSITALATGKTGSITVESNTSWTTTVSDPDWIHIVSGLSGEGDGLVSYSIDANTVTALRTGEITIGDEVCSITQNPSAPFVNPSPSTVNVEAIGGDYTISVLANKSWTAICNNPSWIEILSGTSGDNNGEIDFRVSPNTSTLARTGTLTVGGSIVTIRQNGSGNTIELNPESATYGASGGSGSFTITSDTTWTAVSDVDWISVTSGASGQGNGFVNYSVAANAETAERAGTITVGSETFTVTQTGAAPYVTLDPLGASISAAGGTGTVTITSNTDWTAVSQDPDWFQVTAGAAGTGNGVVSYTVLANPGTDNRSGSINIGGNFFTLVQLGAEPFLDIDPATVDIDAAGGSGSIAISSNGDWSATTAETWIVLDGPTAGSGVGSVAYTVLENLWATERSGVISFGEDLEVTITQSGAEAYVTFDYYERNFPSEGGSGKLAVLSNMEWEAQSDSDWLVIDAGGSATGDGVLDFSLTANDTAAIRTGAITVGDAVLAITQENSIAILEIDSYGADFAFSGGSGSFGVLANLDWQASTTADWIHLDSASGSNDGTLGYTVDANDTEFARWGTIIVSYGPPAMAYRSKRDVVPGEYFVHLVLQNGPTADYDAKISGWIVWELYWDILGRDPSPEELAQRHAAIEGGTLTPVELAYQLLTSEEGLNGAAPSIVRLFQAFFKRYPEFGGLDFWVQQAANGMTLKDVAQEFAQSAEFEDKYGSLSDEDFVTLAYQNVLGRDPDPGGMAYNLGLITDHGWLPSELMLEFSRSEEFRALTWESVYPIVAFYLMGNWAPEGDDLALWANYLLDGGSEQSLAEMALNAEPFIDYFTFPETPSDSEFVETIYDLVLGRVPTTGELTDAVADLESGLVLRSHLFEELLLSVENTILKGPIFRLYRAYFLRFPDTGGFNYWYGLYAGETFTLDEISEQFAVSDEFITTYGSLSNPDFVELVYNNVLGRESEEEGRLFWINAMDSGLLQSEMMTQFAESDEYKLLSENSLLITIAYQALFDRMPLPHEGEQWLTYLENGGSRTYMLLTLLDAYFAPVEATY